MKLNIRKYQAGLLLALCAAACTPDKSTSYFSASMERCRDKDKVVLDGYQPKWESGDTVRVNGCDFYVTQGEGTSQADLGYQGAEPQIATPFHAIYPASASRGNTAVWLPEVQHYSADGMRGFPMYAESNSRTLSFRNLCGALKVTLTSPGVSISRITITADGQLSGAFDIQHDASTSAPALVPSGLGGSVTLECGTGADISSAKDFYLFLPAGTYHSFVMKFYTTDSRVCTKAATMALTIVRNQVDYAAFGASALTFAACGPEGTVGGLFSLGEDRQAWFGRGNVQHNAAEGRYRFADYQYDILGGEATGWTDYFGWAAANGIEMDGFRLPTADEWHYLLNGRSTATGTAPTLGGTADARYAEVMVDGIGGLLLLPDAMSWPAEVAVPSVLNSHCNTSSQEDYTLAEWQKLEDAGCVFLPMAGNSYGDLGCNEGLIGYYWSSTPSSAASAYCLGFNSKFVYSRYVYNRVYGMSVRMVRIND